MKKALFFSVLALTFAFASCRKEAPFNPDSPQIDEKDNAPQAVVFKTNLHNSDTKAAVDEWKSNDLYIFGFNDKEASFSNSFIFNVKAKTAASGATVPFLQDSFTIKKDDGQPYYYGQEDNDKYSFYGYHLGYEPDFDQTPIDIETMSLPVYIKGDNDLMLATTDKEEDAFLADGSMVNPKYLYTEYSARKGVIPNLVFEHQLSRFVFRVKVGGTVDLTETPMKVDDIKMTSQEKATFVIAGANRGIVFPDDTNNKKWLSQIPQVTPAVPFTDLSKDEYKLVDPSGLMISPNDTCTMKITYTQHFNWGDKQSSWKQELKPSDVVDADGNSINATKFEAGKKYIVNVVLYGFEEVKIKVTLTEWDYVGDIWVDKDAKDDGIVYSIAGAAGTEYFVITYKDAEYNVTKEDGTAVADGTYYFTRPTLVNAELKLGFVVANGKITTWIAAQSNDFNSGTTPVTLYHTGALAAQAKVMTINGKAPANGTYANADTAIFVSNGVVETLAVQKTDFTMTSGSSPSTVSLYLYGDYAVGTIVTLDDGSKPAASQLGTTDYTYTHGTPEVTDKVVLAPSNGFMKISKITTQAAPAPTSTPETFYKADGTSCNLIINGNDVFLENGTDPAANGKYYNGTKAVIVAEGKIGVNGNFDTGAIFGDANTVIIWGTLIEGTELSKINSGTHALENVAAGKHGIYTIDDSSKISSVE